MLRPWLDSLQNLWMRNARNRIVIMVSTALIAVLLLCGCLNLLGVLGGGLVDSLITSGPPVRPTLQTGTQVANVNPTFPLPTPTVYDFPNPPEQNVPSSNTPQPTPTPSPTPSETVTPPDGGGNKVTYHISPTDGVLTAGQNNVFTLNGPPGTPVAFSLYFQGSNCVSKFIILDGSGQGSVTCAIPVDLKGSHTTLSLIYNGRDHQDQLQVV